MRLEVPKYVMYGYNSASFVLAMGQNFSSTSTIVIYKEWKLTVKFVF